MVEAGRADVFYGLLLPHGLLELTIIFVAAGAGLRLGWSWIAPGPRTRSQALATEGRAVGALAIGLGVWLLISGLVEGFVTPSTLPAWARLAIGATVWLAFLVYVFTLGRRAARAGETGRRRGGAGGARCPPRPPDRGQHLPRRCDGTLGFDHEACATSPGPVPAGRHPGPGGLRRGRLAYADHRAQRRRRPARHPAGSASPSVDGSASPGSTPGSATPNGTATPGSTPVGTAAATPGGTPPPPTVAPSSCPTVNPIRVNRVDTGPRRATEVVALISTGTNLTSGTREQTDFLTPALTAADGTTITDEATFAQDRDPGGRTAAPGVADPAGTAGRHRLDQPQAVQLARDLRGLQRLEPAGRRRGRAVLRCGADLELRLRGRPQQRSGQLRGRAAAGATPWPGCSSRTTADGQGGDPSNPRRGRKGTREPAM